MKRTLILTPSGMDLSDPLLHALATVLGPAQTVTPGDPAPWPDEAARLVVFTRPGSDGQSLADLLRQKQPWLENVPAGWVAVGDLDPPAEIGQLFPPGQLERLQVAVEAAPGAARQAVIEFALKQRLRHGAGSPVEAQAVQKSLEDFLRAHNTCTLATSFQGRVSSRAIEYRYVEGQLHMVSEGGEKFAGLLTHSQVSVSVYEPYQGFAHLAGVELTGLAALPPWGGPGYERTIGFFNLTLDRLQRLPAPLHAIVITLEKAVFLWSGFAELGLEARQEFSFDSAYPPARADVRA